MILEQRLRDALALLNPSLPVSALDEALRKLTRPEGPTPEARNRAFHRMVVDGMTVEYRTDNGAVRGAQARVIEELIQLAREMRKASARGEELGLTEDELAFYDALETNDSAVQVLGDETLRTIARELVRTVRGSVTIDWTLRENVRSRLRMLVKRILRKSDYPPDKQEKAARTVLEQADPPTGLPCENAPRVLQGSVYPQTTV